MNIRGMIRYLLNNVPWDFMLYSEYKTVCYVRLSIPLQNTEQSILYFHIDGVDRPLEINVSMNTTSSGKIKIQTVKTNSYDTDITKQIEKVVKKSCNGVDISIIEEQMQKTTGLVDTTICSIFQYFY